jgi:inner membrane protein
MPSYKKHTLFALFMALPFFPDIFYLALAVLGSSIIDMDRGVNNRNLLYMFFSGVILTLVLYIVKLDINLGIILIALSFIFLISKHRGFMHSIFGIITIGAFLAIFVSGFYFLLHNFLDPRLILIIIALILGFIILNKKIVPIFAILVVMGLIIIPTSVFSPYYVFGFLVLGGLSHIILDLFTPSGVEIFNPLSSRKYRKNTGIILTIFWGLLVVFNIL